MEVKSQSTKVKSCKAAACAFAARYLGPEHTIWSADDDHPIPFIGLAQGSPKLSFSLSSQTRTRDRRLRRLSRSSAPPWSHQLSHLSRRNFGDQDSCRQRAPVRRKGEPNVRLNHPIFLLFGRLMMSYIFATSGLSKMMGWSGKMQYMSTRHLPMIPALFAMATLLELAGYSLSRSRISGWPSPEACWCWPTAGRGGGQSGSRWWFPRHLQPKRSDCLEPSRQSPQAMSRRSEVATRTGNAGLALARPYCINPPFSVSSWGGMTTAAATRSPGSS